MALRSIFQDETHRDLERRLKALQPEAPARFGRMSAHEAVCHLTDAFLIVLGDRPTRFRADNWFNRTVGRVVALSTPVPWPRGIPTSPEADQEQGGTPPRDFDEDRGALLHQMRRFRDTGGRGLDPHVALGALTPAEWGRWGFRHLDHHLRQFGA